MLYGAPVITFDVLQRAQNNLARVVCQRGGRTDAKPLLRSLHWLPVKQRVTYKMATLTFKVLSSSTPANLNDLIQPAVRVRPLRSSDALMLSAARTRTEFARRAFSVAAPHTWNSLPSDIRSCRTLHTFKNTSKHTCSDSLNLKPPAPPYPLQDFKALYKCCIIIIIIVINDSDTGMWWCSAHYTMACHSAAASTYSYTLRPLLASWHYNVHMPKIIEFYRCIQLLHAKMQGGIAT